MSAPVAVDDLRGLRRMRAVISGPGALGLLLARAAGSLPIGMVPLGVILALRADGRSYALAGVADGAYSVGLAAMSPLMGRMIDRLGMVRVLIPLGVAFPVALVAFALVGPAAPALLAVALALLAGATMPPLGACMRTLWPTLVSESLRGVAFTIDATLQELSFVVGPPLLAGLVAIFDARTALIVAAAMGGAGALVFAARARARHEPAPHAGGALRSAAVRRLLVMSALLGGAFGAVEVALPAFCERHGARPAAGLVLATFAIGSVCGGAIAGGRAPSLSAAQRLLVALGAYALLLVPLLMVATIPLMALLGFFVGMPLAPAFAGAYVLLDRFSVPGALTETFAWNTTAIFAGAAVGTAVGGALIASSGYRASILLALALAGFAVALVAGAARATRRI